MTPLPKCSTLANTPALSSPKMKLRRKRRKEESREEKRVEEI
jgi:hypothetical protein